MPLGAPAVQPSAALVSILVDINIAAAELLTRFLSLVRRKQQELHVTSSIQSGANERLHHGALQSLRCHGIKKSSTVSFVQPVRLPVLISRL